MVTRSVVQSAMHTAATALANLPPEEWAGWIAYLCEALEESIPAQAQDYDLDAVMQDVLRDAIEILQARVERGSW
jgi:hypothetical protein